MKTSILALLIFLTVGAGIMADQIEFSDGMFGDNQWSAELGLVFASNVSFVAEQMETGGMPGHYRHIVHNWSGPGEMWVLHLREDAVFDPSKSGSINSITFSCDLNWFNPPQTPNGVGYYPLIFQNGTYYQGPLLIIQQNSWVSFSVKVTQSEFIRHLPEGNGGTEPDFSDEGSPIQLGFISQNGTASNQTITTISGIDNWSMAIDFEPSILLGDVNCDGSINLLDVGPFVDLLSTGSFDSKADINQDGVVNLLDVAPFVDLLTGG